jgi:hypothetical protein
MIIKEANTVITPSTDDNSVLASLCQKNHVNSHHSNEEISVSTMPHLLTRMMLFAAAIQTAAIQALLQCQLAMMYQARSTFGCNLYFIFYLFYK